MDSAQLPDLMPVRQMMIVAQTHCAATMASAPLQRDNIQCASKTKYVEDIMFCVILWNVFLLSIF